jgi:hypothetical protein
MEYTIHLTNKSTDSQSDLLIYQKSPDTASGKLGAAWADSWMSLPPAPHFEPHAVTINYTEIPNASSKPLPAGRGSQLQVYELQQPGSSDFEWVPIQQTSLVPSLHFPTSLTGSQITYAPLNSGAVSETPAFVVNSLEPER